jgi:hypothetical protein
MGQQRFRCRHCKKLRLKRSPEQRYCGSKACQKARRNAWRRSKLEVDPDYRANQRASTQAWLASQGGSGAYYRGYRKRQRRRVPCSQPADHGAARACRPAAATRAKSDARSPQSRLKSGTYRLVPCDAAKSDALLVQLSIIASS